MTVSVFDRSRLHVIVEAGTGSYQGSFGHQLFAHVVLKIQDASVLSAVERKVL